MVCWKIIAPSQKPSPMLLKCGSQKHRTCFSFTSLHWLLVLFHSFLQNILLLCHATLIFYLIYIIIRGDLTCKLHNTVSLNSKQLCNSETLPPPLLLFSHQLYSGLHTTGCVSSPLSLELGCREFLCHLLCWQISLHQASAKWQQTTALAIAL